MPEITLLVPCYNAAHFLPRLAGYVRALTVPFTSILCYDDGSTDNTVAVAGQLGWPIITPNANEGVAVARNRLAAAATTSWIHFHDADDRIDPRYVERLAPFCAEAHDVVSCDADWINDDATGALQIAWRYDPSELARAPLPYLLTHAMGLNNSIIRRASWEKIGGCDQTLAMWEDADVHIRLARAGARWRHVPEVLTWSLRRSESFSHDYRKSWACRIAALERYAADPTVADVSGPLAVAAETAAAELSLLGERATAERAIALCRRLGVRPPTTRNPLLYMLKSLVPAYVLIRWQARHRRGVNPT